jgi:hypothetical protein
MNIENAAAFLAQQLGQTPEPYQDDIELSIARALVRFGTPYEREGDAELWAEEALIADRAYPWLPPHLVIEDWTAEVMGRSVAA